MPSWDDHLFPEVALATLCENCVALEDLDTLYEKGWDSVQAEYRSEQSSRVHHHDFKVAAFRVTLEDSWPDFGALKRSAASGCSFCHFLLHTLVVERDNCNGDVETQDITVECSAVGGFRGDKNSKEVSRALYGLDVEIHIDSLTTVWTRLLIGSDSSE